MQNTFLTPWLEHAVARGDFLIWPHGLGISPVGVGLFTYQHPQIRTSWLIWDLIRPRHWSIPLERSAARASRRRTGQTLTSFHSVGKGNTLHCSTGTGLWTQWRMELERAKTQTFVTNGLWNEIPVETTMGAYRGASTTADRNKA